MLAIVLWRILFELVNLAKILGFKGKPVLYFAYGANISKTVLRNRKIKILSVEDWMLQGYQFAFNHRGFYTDHGYASIDEDNEATVYGRLIGMFYIDLLRMDFYEGAKVLNRYKRIEITAQGRTFYAYQSCNTANNLSPSADYKNKILEGYKSLSVLPVEWIERLQNTQTIDCQDVPDHVAFLYRKCSYGMLSPYVHAYDRLTAKAFLKFIRPRSLTEKFLKET